MSAKSISLAHGTIPTQMFGNVNLQNAIMYVNENFSAVNDGVNDAIDALNEAVDGKADADHDHDETYAALSHTHAQSEITGLSSALDGKAELNHTHEQYLSSLPTHYHDAGSVTGLSEALQGKAEAVHTHTMAQVENLSTELGAKASTSYVDQQVNSLGTSIKPIADSEIEDYGADEGDSTAGTEGNTPQNVTVAVDNETVAQKNARVGTSKKYARADHKHVIETETDATKFKKDGTASVGTEQKIPRSDHTHPLNVADSGAPSDVVLSTGTAANGSSTAYARQDHVHKMPALTANNITYSGSTTVGGQLDANAAELTSHGTRITALESGGGSAVTSVNGQTGAVVLGAGDVGAIPTTALGVSVQERSAVLDAIADGGLYDTTDGGHEATGNAHYVATASGKARLLGVAANATAVSLRDSIGTDMVSYDGTNTLDDIIGADGKVSGANVEIANAAGSKFVKTAADGTLTEASDTPAAFTGTPTGGKLVKTSGTDGTLEEVDDSMGTATDNTGANSTDNPASAPSISFAGWDAGSSDGLKLRLYALTRYDSSNMEHYFYPIDIEITANGFVKSVKRPTTDAPIRIGA